MLSPGKADLVEWTGPTLIRRDGASGKPVWDASRPAKPWEPEARPGRVDAAAVVFRRRETARQRWSSPPRTSTATARPTSSGRFESRRRSWHSPARTGRCSGLIRPRVTARRAGPSWPGVAPVDRAGSPPGPSSRLSVAAGRRRRRHRGPHRGIRPLRRRPPMLDLPDRTSGLRHGGVGRMGPPRPARGRGRLGTLGTSPVEPSDRSDSRRPAETSL